MVREAIGDVDISNGLRAVEDSPPIGQVALLKQKHSGIGGDRLNYVPKDDWDVRKSTEILQNSFRLTTFSQRKIPLGWPGENSFWLEIEGLF